MPRLFTLNALAKGINIKPPVASRVVAANALRYSGREIVLKRCSKGFRVEGIFKCALTGFKKIIIKTPTTRQITTIITNGECQPNLFARYNPTGIPKTWLDAN